MSSNKSLTAAVCPTIVQATVRAANEEQRMSKPKVIADMRNPEDSRIFMTIVAFVYSPLVPMLAAAAVIGLS